MADFERIDLPGRRWDSGSETDDGDLFLVLRGWVEAGTRDHWYGSPIAGQRVRYVSLCSRYAGGQIRGYWLDEQGRLWLESSGGSGRWLEADALVAGGLGASVVSYEWSAGGDRVWYHPGAAQLALPGVTRG